MRKANRPDKDPVGDETQWISRLSRQTNLDCSPEQVTTARRVGRHKISDDDVAGLFDRLATGSSRSLSVDGRCLGIVLQLP